MSESRNRTLLLSLLVAGLSLFNVAQAQTIPGGVAITTNQVIDLMQSIAGFLFVAGTILAGVAILYSGVTYMLAGPDSSKVKVAKDVLRAGLIGAVIIFGVGMILRTITGFAGNPLGFFGGSGGGSIAPAYGCVNGQCVQQIGGPYSVSNCNNLCQ